MAQMMFGVAVAAVGGVGALCRYLLDGFVEDRSKGVLPIGTLFVNLVGSLCIGIVAGLVAEHGNSDSAVVLVVGFCGGLTTFSAAAWESVQLGRHKTHLIGFAYMITTGALSVLLCATSYLLTKALVR